MGDPWTGHPPITPRADASAKCAVGERVPNQGRRALREEPNQCRHEKPSPPPSAPGQPSPRVCAYSSG
jgi:hypothetical protein